jgi:hypothetical protein
MGNVKAKILQRFHPCNCGCQGRDPQHAKHVVRVVQDVTTFDVVAPSGTVFVVAAQGHYSHPEGARDCVLVRAYIDGKPLSASWYANRAWFGGK